MKKLSCNSEAEINELSEKIPYPKENDFKEDISSNFQLNNALFKRKNCQLYNSYSRINFEYAGGNGRSYDVGYASVGFFKAFFPNCLNRYLFIDLNGRRLNPGRLVLNTGLGWRCFFNNFKEMFGLNFFYDYRRLLKKNFNQLGIGLELLSYYWDVRVNGYLPIGKKRAFELEEIIDYGDGYLEIVRQFQEAFWGIDVEIGKEFCLSKNFIGYIGIGPYFYDKAKNDGCSSSFLGGQGRIALKIYKYINFEFSTTYDRFFNFKPQGIIRISLPLGCSKCFDWCLFRAIRRNPIILTSENCTFEANF